MKKFDIIYADPSWPYRDKLKHLWAWAENHYPVMKIWDIASLWISKMANNDSILCMWATMPLLEEALLVIREWGFKYKTCLITWVKTYPVQTDKFVLWMWYYSRSNIEICLLATKGKGLPVLNHSTSQLLISPRRSHSQKPDWARDIIETIFWKRRRIELFWRNRTKWWKVVGNEIDGITIEDFIKQNYDNTK